MTDSKQAAARRRFGLVGILRFPELVDSLEEVLVVSEACGRGPRGLAEYIVDAHTPGQARGVLRIQRLLRRLLRGRMSSVECRRQVAAQYQVVHLGVHVIVIGDFRRGAVPHTQQRVR